MSGSYTCRLYDRESDVDQAEWGTVCDASVNPSMDLRFLDLLNNSMPRSSRTWAAVIRNQDGQAVAATYFSLYAVDGALFLPRFLVPPTNLIRRLWPRYLYFRIVICGHPIGIGQSSLQMRPEADPKELAIVLDATATELATKHRAGLILFKEFTANETEQLRELKQLGYLQEQSVVTYTLQSQSDSFDSYYQSRSKRTRANMRKYFAKLEVAGMTYEHRPGCEMANRFTDDVYGLYQNVLQRASFRFEVVPIEFFQQLALRFPTESCFTLINDGNRIVGFCCGLGTQSHHMLLYCGIDYERNDEAAIYFNTLYRGLTPAFAAGVKTINLGQSADEFKRRLGCDGEPLHIFTKPTRWVLRILYRHFAKPDP